jgi:prepilin-type processing-associated H-X9-DG protein
LGAKRRWFANRWWQLARGAPLPIRPIVDTFTGSTTETDVFTNSFGWRVRDDGSPLIYGGAWPWHNGKVNIAYVDGSARDVTTQQLGAGCDVQNDWKGYISDPDAYLWDAR